MHREGLLAMTFLDDVKYCLSFFELCEANRLKMEENIKGGLPNIVWDDSDARSVYADIAQVKASRDEFMLLFGNSHSATSDRNGLRVKLDRRIVLNPSGAKRLAIQLSRGVLDYESKLGSLDREGTVRERLVPTPFLNPPHFRHSKGPETVDLLFKFLKDQDARPAFEHSFKMIEQNLFENRFLMGFEKGSIRNDPDEKIIRICQRIGMPEDFIEEFRENLPQSNIIGFGFGEDERAFIVKAYLEFGGRFFRAVKSKPGDPEPYLSHLGFKWDAENNTRKVLTRYTCFPGYGTEEIVARLSDDFYDKISEGPFEIVKGILAFASRRAGSGRFLFLEVREEESERSSFDINVYRANIRLRDVYSFLSDMARHYSVPPARFEKTYEQAKDHVLGHLAGGRDGKGRCFMTIYSGE